MMTRSKISESEIVELLNRKTPQKLNLRNGIDFDVCDWCKGETYALHGHHHPIPKSKGGKEIVNICANCHYEFHELKTSFFYKPIPEIQKAFEKSINAKKDLLKEFDRRSAACQ